MQLKLGEPIPEWEIEPIFGSTLHSVEEFRKKPLVVLLFSLHCPGCVGRALPYANRIVVEKGDQINVVGIHTHFEGPETNRDVLIDAKDKYYIRFPYFTDKGFASTFHKYGAGGTPHWIVTDQEGLVVESIFGSDPNRALLKLDYLLNELTQ